MVLRKYQKMEKKWITPNGLYIASSVIVFLNKINYFSGTTFHTSFDSRNFNLNVQNCTIFKQTYSWYPQIYFQEASLKVDNDKRFYKPCLQTTIESFFTQKYRHFPRWRRRLQTSQTNTQKSISLSNLTPSPCWLYKQNDRLRC